MGADPTPCTLRPLELQSTTGVELPVSSGVIISKFSVRLPAEATALRTCFEKRKSEMLGKRKSQDGELSDLRKKQFLLVENDTAISPEV